MTTKIKIAIVQGHKPVRVFLCDEHGTPFGEGVVMSEVGSESEMYVHVHQSVRVVEESE